MIIREKKKTEDFANYSDWHLYGLLIQNHPLDELSLYKACVSVSAHGTILPQAINLDPCFQILLEVRRQNHREDYDQSLLLIEQVESRVSGSSVFAAESWFLRGVISNRLGENEKAGREFMKAQPIYLALGQSHRSLRALINAKICERNFENSIHGELLALEQEARRLKYFDLVGNITKARAIELGVHGNFFAALLEAEESVKNYKQEGFPEDYDIALSLVSIFGHLCGESTKAAWAFHEIKSKGGKVQSYIDAYLNLLSGRNPVLPKGHALHGVKWKIQSKKVSSITGKIVTRLRQSPATRDEIIENVWGPQALDPSYHSRFYSALAQIRRTQGMAVLFDGSQYRLQSS